MLRECSCTSARRCLATSGSIPAPRTLQRRPLHRHAARRPRRPLRQLPCELQCTSRVWKLSMEERLLWCPQQRVRPRLPLGGPGRWQPEGLKGLNGAPNRLLVLPSDPACAGPHSAPTSAAHERAGHLWLVVGPARRPFFNMLQAWKHPLDRHHCRRRAPGTSTGSSEHAGMMVTVRVADSGLSGTVP